MASKSTTSIVPNPAMYSRPTILTQDEINSPVNSFPLTFCTIVSASTPLWFELLVEEGEEEEVGGEGRGVVPL
ncbi:hypothetical protein BTUL_0146g00200 [Botrytis tulipae]|uniref:Uncharacterized protein n=1 Tax=Botrytis tulipae TaxID=87230 RepID=A0A4Z1EGZ5_9HELO|nr:hypothetical protein BTUL_0146g00200 [Botrytis tulipae]